jgi:hypothetical protein
VTVTEREDFKMAVAASSPWGVGGFEGAVEVSETSLVLDPEISWERYEAIVGFVGRLTRACCWWTGTLVNYGEARWGERYSQVMESSGLSYDRLSTIAWVERRVPPSNRKPGLSFSHHEAVAKLPPTRQRLLLDRAARENLSVRQTREARQAILSPSTKLAEPPVSSLEEAARAISAQAVKRGDHYEIPEEPMARLRRALGE